MMTTKKIKLNTWGRNYVVVSASQGEVNSRFLEITLVDEMGTMTLTGKEVILYAVKPDGNIIFNNCVIEDESQMIVSVELTSQMSGTPGVMICELHVMGSSQEVLKIVGFEIVILKCSDTSQSVESTSEFTRLSEALNDVEVLKDEYQELIDSPLHYLGVWPVANGGTGNYSFNSGNILIGNGTDAVTTVSTLSISKGGTGASDASEALTNLGMTMELGTWTPIVISDSTFPTVTYSYQYGTYYRIGRLVYISCRLNCTISNVGTGYARIGGLPYTSTSTTYGALSKLTEYNAINETYCRGYVGSSSTQISIRQETGTLPATWKLSTGSGQIIGFGGCYIKASD